MNWDTFTFDYKLDTAGFISDLISVEAHKQSAQNLVLPPDWRKQLDRLNRVRAVHGTTALEGNPLSEEEVSRQIEIAEQPSDTARLRATKEQQQIRNAGLTQEWTRTRFGPDRAPLHVEDILQMHKMITESSDENHNIPGQFRDFSVVVGSLDLGGVHRGAPHDSIPRLIDEYINFVNSRAIESLHPVMRALLAHFFWSPYIHLAMAMGAYHGLLRPGYCFRVATTSSGSTAFPITSIGTKPNTKPLCSSAGEFNHSMSLVSSSSGCAGSLKSLRESTIS